MKTYSELMQFQTFEDRFNYLKLDGTVAETTFGFDRYLNQSLYQSKEWRRLRNEIIVRDDGCDMAFPDNKIGYKIFIHHMNPISQRDIEDRSDVIFDPEFLICVSQDTHNAIHFGDASLLPKGLIERRSGDTCPWR